MLWKIKIIFHYTLENLFNKLRKIIYLNIFITLEKIIYFKSINLRYLIKKSGSGVRA
jgi:hypothetical protein